MSADAAVRGGRRAAEALMIDTCTITRGGGEEVYDPATDSYVTEPGVAVYEGPCRVKPQDNASREVDAGAKTVALWPFQVAVPMSAAGIEDDDVVTVTASRLDADLVGLVLRVRQVAQGTFVTARRLGCEVQT